MLKALLASGCYVIEQAERLEGIADLVRETRPDLIITAWTLSDGSAVDLRAALNAIDPQRQIPVLAIAPHKAGDDRSTALAAGLADVLPSPLDEGFVHARIRSLLRGRPAADVLALSDTVNQALGFSETAPAFARPQRIAVIAEDRGTALRWQTGLSVRLRQTVSGYGITERRALASSDRAPDAIVVAAKGGAEDPAMRLLSDLRAHDPTRDTVIVAVPDTWIPAEAARAMDLGADDVLPAPYDVKELALRLQSLLQRKQRADMMRDTVRNGLRAALIDPMTGLHNRRFALPHLARTARQSARSGRPFAVMLADLDHFKLINDRYGHQAGDAILTEVASRLSAAVRPQDVVARVGGEEFLIIMPDTDTRTANKAAKSICDQIGARPMFIASGLSTNVTVSIGVVVSQPASDDGPTKLARFDIGEPGLPAQLSDPGDTLARSLIGQADQALYESKDAGRNTVTLKSCAA